MASACYAIDGTLFENTKATYVPCDPDAVANGKHSSCCNIGDLCMSNGLCIEQQNVKKGANHYWRNGCTDKTWKDPACPNFCKGREELDLKSAFILYCFDPQDEWCCAPSGTVGNIVGRNTTCCNNDKLVFRAEKPEILATAVEGQIPLVTTRSSSTSSSQRSTTTTSEESSQTLTSATGNAAQDPSSTPSIITAPSAGMSTGAKAGMGVGITLGVLVIIGALAAFFIMRRRKTRAYNNAVFVSDSKTNPPPYVTYESAGTVRAELEGTELPAEMYFLGKKSASVTSQAEASSATARPQSARDTIARA